MATLNQNYQEKIIKQVITASLNRYHILYDYCYSPREFAYIIKAFDKETRVEFSVPIHDSISCVKNTEEILTLFKFYEIREEFKQYRNKLWC